MTKKKPMWLIRQTLAEVQEHYYSLYMGMPKGEEKDGKQTMICYVRDEYNILGTFTLIYLKDKYSIIEMNILNVYPTKCIKIATMLNEFEETLNNEGENKDEIPS